MASKDLDQWLKRLKELENEEIDANVDTDNSDSGGDIVEGSKPNTDIEQEV